MEDRFGVKITTRDGWIKLDGAPASIAKARDVFQQSTSRARRGLYIRKTEFNFALESVAKGNGDQAARSPCRAHSNFGQEAPIIPKSLQQKKYVEAVKTTT